MQERKEPESRAIYLFCSRVGECGRDGAALNHHTWFLSTVLILRVWSTSPCLNMSVLVCIREIYDAHSGCILEEDQLTESIWLAHPKAWESVCVSRADILLSLLLWDPPAYNILTLVAICYRHYYLIASLIPLVPHLPYINISASL